MTITGARTLGLPTLAECAATVAPLGVAAAANGEAAIEATDTAPTPTATFRRTLNPVTPVFLNCIFGSSRITVIVDLNGVQL